MACTRYISQIQTSPSSATRHSLSGFVKSLVAECLRSEALQQPRLLRVMAGHEQRQQRKCCNYRSHRRARRPSYPPHDIGQGEHSSVPSPQQPTGVKEHPCGTISDDWKGCSLVSRATIVSTPGIPAAAHAVGVQRTRWGRGGAGMGKTLAQRVLGRNLESGEVTSSRACFPLPAGAVSVFVCIGLRRTVLSRLLSQSRPTSRCCACCMYSSSSWQSRASSPSRCEYVRTGLPFRASRSCRDRSACVPEADAPDCSTNAHTLICAAAWIWCRSASLSTTLST